MFHQEPLGDFPMLAWLLHRRCQARCCLRPRGVGRHSSITRLPFCLRLLSRDRHIPKIHNSRGYGSDSGHTPFTSLDSRIVQSIGPYATGRLTKPYPGGLMLSHPLSTLNQSQVRTIIIVEQSIWQHRRVLEAVLGTLPDICSNDFIGYFYFIYL